MIGRVLVVGLVCLTVPMGLTVRAGEPPRPPHHEIDLRLDPMSGRLDVIDRLTVSGPETIDLRLASWLRIADATVDGQPVAGEPQRLTVEDSAVHQILVTYGGVLVPRSVSAGEPADDGPLIGPEGSFLPPGTGWLPTVGGERVTYSVTISVPAGVRAVATGDLLAEEEAEGLYRATFATALPSEPPTVFAGPYAVREQRRAGIRLRTYFHPELGQWADTYLDLAAGYLERFQQRIGNYPFTDFFVISSPLPVGLGFRNLTYVGRRVLPLPFMRGRSLAHEILHNWWGNGVYVDHATGNWSEGLTTYMADYALAAEQGVDAATEMRLDWLRDFSALPSERDFPLAAFTARRHGASQVVGYDKAAFVFLMLDDEINANAFGEGIRLFWRRHAFATAGWGDLRRAFEDASGRDLSRFFEQWVERPGAPRLDIVSVRAEATDAGHRVALALRQSSPNYNLRVPVSVETANGPTRTVVRLADAETSIAIELDAVPLAVVVDPDHQVFRRLAHREMPSILREVTLATATRVVIAADGDDARETARTLAEKLLDQPPGFAAAESPSPDGAPLLLIGTPPAVGRTMDALGLGTVPAVLVGQGTAQAWAGRGADDRPFAVVVADDGAALAALMRPLPHYGRMSYLAFDAAKATITGVWPAGESPLRRTLGQPLGTEPGAGPG